MAMAHFINHTRPHGNGPLRKVPFFADLSDEEIKGIEQLMIKRHFSRGQVVLFEEDTSNYMYVVFSGKVRVVQSSRTGKERILAIHRRGDYFGEMSLLDGKTQPATVIAMDESDIALLSKRDFEMFVLKNQQVLFQFMFTLCSRLRESWRMLKIMSFADAEERVRAVLRNMSKLYGVKEQRGVLVSLKLTHKDIANYASVSRETVSRLMNRFSREGEIEILEKRHILLKPIFLKKNHSL